jgi:hypothetical protein
MQFIEAGLLASGKPRRKPSVMRAYKGYVYRQLKDDTYVMRVGLRSWTGSEDVIHSAIDKILDSDIQGNI